MQFVKPEQVSTGNITLVKTDKDAAPVTLIKKTDEGMVAVISWTTGKDYDVYALVVLKTGEVVTVATFGAEFKGSLLRKGRVEKRMSYNGIEHLGDVVASDVIRDGRGTESLRIRFDDTIRAVVPVVYSAQSSGTGSFKRHDVSMLVDNGAGDKVEIPAANANDDDRIYSCVPAVLHNLDDGVVIQALELYSSRNSENRPAVELRRGDEVVVLMDKGPRNDYK